MLEIIIFIVGFEIGMFFVWSYFRRSRNGAARGKTRIIYTGRAKEKEKNIGKILGHVWHNNRITNNDVEDLLDVSDATATRYLEELEERGRIVQKGDGRSTYYELT